MDIQLSVSLAFPDPQSLGRDWPGTASRQYCQLSIEDTCRDHGTAQAGMKAYLPSIRRVLQHFCQISGIFTDITPYRTDITSSSRSTTDSMPRSKDSVTANAQR